MTARGQISSVTTARRASAVPEPSEALITSHLPLVGHLVREVLNRVPTHVNRDDLVSAGMLALTLSARSFDPDRGIPFAGFATIRIRGALTDELRSMDWASRSVRSRAREVERVEVDLSRSLGRTPSRDELANATGMTRRELDSVARDVERASVLSIQRLTEDGGVELEGDTGGGPESLLLHRERLGLLRDAIAELPERLRTVVEQYFIQQRKMAAIAAELGVTESRVSQLRSEALILLRAAMADEQPEAQVATVEALDAPRRRTKDSGRAAYCAAVSSRSSLAERLSASNLLGDMVRVAAV